jgi:hypothetical protein
VVRRRSKSGTENAERSGGRNHYERLVSSHGSLLPVC